VLSSTFPLRHYQDHRPLTTIPQYGSHRASPEQLKKLAHLIISSYHSVSQSPARTHTLHTLTNLLLRQAPFAELTTLRQHILGALQTYTDMSSGSPSAAQSSAYDFLLSMPIEYLPKQQRIELAKRALQLERAIKLTSAKGVSPREITDRLQAREVLRRFTATVFREANVIGSIVSGTSFRPCNSLEAYIRSISSSDGRPNNLGLCDGPEPV
jgi:hypothetical protein